jgi:hypothetical protein
MIIPVCELTERRQAIEKARDSESAFVIRL